jgi:hypothetical protein
VARREDVGPACALNREAQRMVGPAGRGQLIVRQWQAAPLSPFLQGGLRIARGLFHLGNQRLPKALDELEKREVTIADGSMRLVDVSREYVERLAEDLAVDELTGTVYWISAGELWKAHIPL